MTGLKEKLESMLILFLTKKDDTVQFSRDSENTVGFLVLTIEESGEIQTVFKITSKDKKLIKDLLKSADLFSKTNKEAKMPTNESSEEKKGDVSQPKSTKTEEEVNLNSVRAEIFNGEDVQAKITQLMKSSGLFDLVDKKRTGQASTKQEDGDNQQMHQNEFQKFFERAQVVLNEMLSNEHGSEGSTNAVNEVILTKDKSVGRNNSV